jgi:hypothetical protein
MNNEPRNYRNNVHFWLRKIYYFVVSVKDERVEIDEENPTAGKKIPDRTERQIRQDLNLPDFITKEEAIEACAKLYEMFNMPLDSDVLDFIEDPRCPGGRPRSKF